MGFLKNVFNDTCKGYDKVKTNTKLTYEELYDVIKDGNFSSGKPELTGSGIMKCIKFPPVDKYVVQLAITGTTITITKIYSGVGGFAKEEVGDMFTHGFYSAFNKENIDQNRATREIGEEITNLLKAKGLLAE